MLVTDVSNQFEFLMTPIADLVINGLYLLVKGSNIDFGLQYPKDAILI